jgi:hypothetical protein
MMHTQVQENVGALGWRLSKSEVHQKNKLKQSLRPGA